MDNDQVRQEFLKKLGARSKENGWEQISDSDIYALASHIAKLLEMHVPSLHTNQKYRIGKIVINKNERGTIESADIRMITEGDEERQGVSFENNGFIGFCGWASSRNSMPFLYGFLNWLEGK